jgi:hypothetical protein
VEVFGVAPAKTAPGAVFELYQTSPKQVLSFKKKKPKQVPRNSHNIMTKAKNKI